MNGKGSTRRKAFVKNETFASNWDKAFVKDKTFHIKDEQEQNFKNKQQDLTELNGDGNRERGRYGEDQS